VVTLGTNKQQKMTITQFPKTIEQEPMREFVIPGAQGPILIVLNLEKDFEK
jgi:hypothetical protein